MSSPLANKIRPTTLDQVVGQNHLLDKTKLLRKIIESKKIPNMIFYGPSGVGKTTVATIISNITDKYLYKLNGTTASTSDIKDIINNIDTLHTQNGILLYLDEIQYLNKRQQQTLLEFIETGKITLIASTTENPYFYIYNAILSRCTVFEFKMIEPNETKKAIKRAFDYLREDLKRDIIISDETMFKIALRCNNDVRKALNIVELSVLSGINKEGKIKITNECIDELTTNSTMSYDKNGDNHYDILSAFQKSMRGSDANAAVHYLARLLLCGDILSACRRLMVCVCEDVGLAYPQIMPVVKSCVDMALQLGMPEARIPLANAVIMVCNAPKSNSAYMAINGAMYDIENINTGDIPRHLQNMHFDGEDNQNKGQFYKYPHDYENSWIDQQYLPDAIKNKKYYKFGNNKTEQAYKSYWDKIKPYK